MINEKKSLEEAIKHVVNYYAYFEYSPSFEEIYTFLPIKTTKKALKQAYQTLLPYKTSQNTKYKIQNTIPGEGIHEKNKSIKKTISEHKIASISLYIRVVSIIAPVQLIGLSGSIAMMDADPSDDIDVFIISKASRIWAARFMCLSIAWVLGLRRKRNQKKAANKVCLNLFFDERELSVPIHKRNEYTAHEVLQMKPLINKNQTHEKFLYDNKWVTDNFPNASHPSLQSASWRRSNLKVKTRLPRSFQSLAMTTGDIIEIFLKILQLFLINRHKTTEIITNTQLWFFPRDFEKKLKSKKII